MLYIKRADLLFLLCFTHHCNHDLQTSFHVMYFSSILLHSVQTTGFSQLSKHLTMHLLLLLITLIIE